MRFIQELWLYNLLNLFFKMCLFLPALLKLVEKESTTGMIDPSILKSIIISQPESASSDDSGVSLVLYERWCVLQALFNMFSLWKI